jgi:hypothetical protein
VSCYISGISHVGAGYGGQSKILDGIDLRNVVTIYQSGCIGVAREGVKLFCPCCLYFCRAEPLSKCLNRFCLLLGTSCLIQDTDVLSNVISTICNVY